MAEVFPTSWDTVFGAVCMAVEWGRAHHDLGGIEALGIDEIAWQRGHRYLTLVSQTDAHCKRLLWVGRERKSETLHGFFDGFGPARTEAVRFVCSDMWKAYLRVIAERAGQAVHVLDRFHIMSHFGKAIDKVRAEEARKLQAQGKAPVLEHSRWLLLERPENLTDVQHDKLADLVRICARCAPICSKRTSSRCGGTCRPIGPDASSVIPAEAGTDGAPEPCALASSR